MIKTKITLVVNARCMNCEHSIVDEELDALVCKRHESQKVEDDNCCEGWAISPERVKEICS